MAKENMDERWGFETRAIHVGQKPDPQTGAITVPVYQTTTYEQDEVGKDRGMSIRELKPYQRCFRGEYCSVRRRRVWKSIR